MKMLAEKRALDKVYKRRDRYEIPDWQREEVWSRDKKQKLIDSILRGWRLPKLYLLRIPEQRDEFEVVDGQQRLITIFEFFDNELPLSDDSAQEFEGHYYRDLPEAVSDDFDDFEIEYDVIEDADDTEIREFFQRLQDGLPLTSSEKLNAIHSALRDFCRELAKHPFLTEKTAVSARRYGLFDVVSKVAAIEVEGIDVGLRYADLKEVFESQANFSQNSLVAQRLTETFDYLDGVFPTKEPRLRNRTLAQSLATLTAKIVAGGSSTGHEPELRAFFTTFLNELSRQVELGQEATDTDFLAFQKTVNANVRSGARTRQEVLLRKLLVYDPSSAVLFDPATISESGMGQQIARSAESISALVFSINAKYASVNGIDLFKATNKTTHALSKMGKPIRDFTAYKDFVDDLWFVFHEGAGQRLAAKPASLVDVNELRTDLRHDVDHGKASKAASKRRKGGTVFRKYARAGTPPTLDPQQFPLVQAALLNAIERDLRGLLKSI